MNYPYLLELVKLRCKEYGRDTSDVNNMRALQQVSSYFSWSDTLEDWRFWSKVSNLAQNGHSLDEEELYAKSIFDPNN